MITYEICSALDLFSAICSKFSPETMLPFAANVVC